MVFIKTKIEQVLERCLNNREIVIWGNPTRLLLRILKPYKICASNNIAIMGDVCHLNGIVIMQK